MAMTVGGKIAVVAVTAVAVVSTAGAGYLYIEKEKAVVQTVAVMAEISDLQEEMKQQGEAIKMLETEKNSLLGVVEEIKDEATKHSSTVNGLTDIEQEAYDMLIDMGLTPEAAMEALTGTPQTDPSDGTGGTTGNNGGTTPPVNNGDTTPPVNNGGGKPAGGNTPNGGSGNGDGATDEELKAFLGDSYNPDDRGGDTVVNPEDLEGIS